MTMKGELVPPEGLDHIKTLQKWLEQYPNDVMVRSKLADLQRDPRFAEPDEPDDIMPQIPELAEFPVPPGLKKYIDATRIVAGASVPTSAACIAAAFNLLAAEDIDVQSRANAPHPSGLYFVVGSESGWRKSASFRETMKGHVEADERVDALHHEADSDTEEGMEFRVKGFSPRALRQDFTIEATFPKLELQPPNAFVAIVLDCDTPSESGWPGGKPSILPSWLVINTRPATPERRPGGLHAVYALEVPVARHNAAHTLPLTYLAHVADRLRTTAL